MSKHTPGPWTADWDDNGFICIDPIRACIPNVNDDGGIEMANALLIAAAPDLLEMLKRARKRIPDESNIAAPIDAVIAKAEGTK